MSGERSRPHRGKSGRPSHRLAKPSTLDWEGAAVLKSLLAVWLVVWRFGVIMTLHGN
jgi:hypothetical protein